MIERKALQRRALILVWIGFTWNFIEAAVALCSVFIADSVALLAFGLDSLVEIFAGAVLIRAPALLAEATWISRISLFMMQMST